MYYKAYNYWHPSQPSRTLSLDEWEQIKASLFPWQIEAVECGKGTLTGRLVIWKELGEPAAIISCGRPAEA